MKLKAKLTEILFEAIQSEFGITVSSVQISRSKNPEFGDLSTNLPLLLAKDLKKSALEIAGQIQSVLILDKSFFVDATISKPGFINFTISPTYFYSVLDDVLTEDVRFFKGSGGIGKTALVEFVSANPTGPLSVGHGRQAVLGDTVSNILQWHGYNVTREYYYNDAGRQMRILADSVEARYHELTNSKSNFPDDGYQGEYIKDIAKSIQTKHGNALSPGDKVIGDTAEEIIFDGIKSTLQTLQIEFDNFANERTYYESGAINKVIDRLKQKNLIYTADEATWFKTSTLGMEKDRVLIKNSGEPTYRLPDIAYHIDKVERNFDLIVDIFGADHQDTYPDVLAGLHCLGYDTNTIKVLIHQFVTLMRGGEKVKMSTRKATFVTLDELLDKLGPDVVRYFFLMRGMNSHLNFDLELAEDQSVKNPVFYLQYAHARICNIIKRGEEHGLTIKKKYDPHLLTHPTEIALLKQLDMFPEIMDVLLESLEPQMLVNYLQSLATHFHKFYTECQVLTNDLALSHVRIALIYSVKMILACGLKILGVSAPLKM
ncbi:arginine--tRNA ligase [Candidatus Neomarinimicrobiota bacterium]